MRHETMSPPRKPDCQGFTLIELLIVVIILGLLAGVAGLAATDSDAQALELAAIQVTDTIERAQNLARSSREPFGVVFETGSDRVVLVDVTGTPTIDPLTKRDFFLDFSLPGQPAMIVIGTADFGTTGRAVIFDPQGVPLEGGSLTLTRRSDSLVLTVDPATGAVTSS
jgi:prepilin-type N-terminal cleavage/methylation domain-containing protein